PVFKFELAPQQRAGIIRDALNRATQVIGQFRLRIVGSHSAQIVSLRLTGLVLALLLQTLVHLLLQGLPRLLFACLLFCFLLCRLRLGFARASSVLLGLVLRLILARRTAVFGCLPLVLLRFALLLLLLRVRRLVVVLRGLILILAAVCAATPRPYPGWPSRPHARDRASVRDHRHRSLPDTFPCGQAHCPGCIE